MPTSPSTALAPFRNRIIGYGDIDPALLLANPRNWRIHPRKQQDALEGVLEEVGWVGVVLVNKTTGFLVDGHARVRIALRRNEKTVPCAFCELTEAEEALILATLDPIAAMAVTDDALLGELVAETRAEDGRVNALLESLIGAKLARDPLEVAEPVPVVVPTDPITKVGDLIRLGRHRVMCGDATSGRDMALLLEGVVPALCLTDPPYCSGGFQEAGRAAGSVGTDAVHKQIANDRLSTRGYQALLKQAISNTGAAYLYAFTDWRMWVWLFDIAESCGFAVRSMIVWDKGTPGMGRGWRSQHELVLWATKATAPFDKHASGKGNVIGEKRTGNIHHTTEKPVVVLRELLENTPFAQTVVDPFAGSGTTLIACEAEDRTCFAMEMDAGYCDVIVERWESLTGLKAERLGAVIPVTSEAKSE